MKLAVLFPGIGYHIDKPLLYYAKSLAAGQGYEVAAADYGGLPADAKSSAEKMKLAFEIAFEHSITSLAAVEWEKYEKILFISKSIGTAVSAAVADRLKIKTKNIYFTPVRETFFFPLQEGIAFHGTADSWVDTQVIQTACKEREIPLFITPKANHSMETEEPLYNIRLLEQIMEEVKQYIR